MVDTASRLIDEILPPVPVRQWVLSLPFKIRYRLAWDGKLVSAVLRSFSASSTAGIGGKPSSWATPAAAVVR